MAAGSLTDHSAKSARLRHEEGFIHFVAGFVTVTTVVVAFDHVFRNFLASNMHAV